MLGYYTNKMWSAFTGIFIACFSLHFFSISSLHEGAQTYYKALQDTSFPSLPLYTSLLSIWPCWPLILFLALTTLPTIFALCSLPLTGLSLEESYRWIFPELPHSHPFSFILFLFIGLLAIEKVRFWVSLPPPGCAWHRAGLRVTSAGSRAVPGIE